MPRSTFVRRVRSLASRLRSVLWTPEQLSRLAEEQMETRQQLLHDNRELTAAVLREQLSLQHQVDELRLELSALADSMTAADRTTSEERRRTEASLGRSIAAVGEALARLEAPDAAVLVDGPLVSIVLPVRDRRDVVAAAVRSVLAQTYTSWELLVVDDRSADDSAAVVKSVAGDDARVRILEGEGRGVAAARNIALGAARGEIVAYLDSDNRWLANYLAHLVVTYRDRPDAGSAIAMQIVVDDRTRQWSIRDDDHHEEDLERLNFVDLNAYSHRRELIDVIGVFDESLRRLSDWDLVRRFVAERPLARLAVPGSVYRTGRSDQISQTEPVGYYEHLVRSKERRVPAEGLRVLCAEWHYPQLSETYIQSDIDGLKRLGAHVEVWSEEDRTAAPYPTEERVHRGALADAIDSVRPHVVLTHWLNIGANLADDVTRTGVPMVVRGHGFEFTSETAASLADHPGVARIYVFPHFLRQAQDERIRPLPVGFDAQRYAPATAKDRSLVVRGGVAIPTKNYQSFFEIASGCPDHRFVLCLVTAHRREEYLDEVIAQRDALDAPVDIRVDVPHREMVELVSSAGIYVHTHNELSPFGMPISVAEAMATGSYVLAPDLPGCAAYLADGGHVYGSVDDAVARIRRTALWTDVQWRDQAMRAIDRSFGSFTNLRVAEAMVSDWRQCGLVPPTTQAF